MKRLVVSLGIVSILLLPTALLAAEQRCEFNIVGTWQAATPNTATPTVFRFGADGRVTVISRETPDQGSEWRIGDTFRYKLDDPKAPKAIAFVPAKDENGTMPSGAMKISAFDDGSFTTASPEEPPTRWVRVDDHRYYVVFSARKGSLEFGGPAFVTLISTDGKTPRSESFGIYMKTDLRIKLETYIVGPMPRNIHKQFAKEPKSDSDVMLRIEVPAPAFARSMSVMRTWQRRAREGTLLYLVPFLNNMIFLEQTAESLNNCGEQVRAHKLTWTVHDKIISKHNLTQTGFFYIKDLRELNDARHVSDAKFQEPWEPASLPNSNTIARSASR